jgi:probable rRNA maturation factor
MYDIIVQRAIQDPSLPTTAHIRQWARAVLNDRVDEAEITIRIVGSEEMAVLNQTWRNKSGATNVLSFPLEETPLVGDIIICAAVVASEAVTQAKSFEAHFAHMVVHGVLHLLGYDHVELPDAEIMEGEEIAILDSLGFADPYQLGAKI